MRGREGHDRHHTEPRPKPPGLAGYLDVLARAMFQAGIDWRVVEAKWDGIRAAFHDFDPKTVAAMGDADVERLMGDPRVIRNRRKLEAVIDNANMLLELDAEPGGFKGYLHSFESYDELVKDLTGRFKWLGDTGAYYFLWVVGEKVPAWEERHGSSARR